MGTVSVALCTYNGARFLRNQVDSILSQTEPPDEIVVCDDGSADETLDILAALRQSAPGLFRIVRNEVRLGYAKNFEKAIGLCTGDIIALCDQDDVWVPRKLEIMRRAFQTAPTALGVFSDADLTDADLTPIGSLWRSLDFKMPESDADGDALFRHLLRRECVTGCTMGIRRSAVPTLLPIAPGWVHDYWMSVLLALRSALLPIPQRLVLYRQHGGNQIGVHESRGPARVALARSRTAYRYASAALQWAELVRHAADVSPATSTVACGRMNMLQARAAFSASRAAAVRGGWGQRVRFATRAWANGSYARFAAGSYSGLRDIVFGARDR